MYAPTLLISFSACSARLGQCRQRLSTHREANKEGDGIVGSSTLRRLPRGFIDFIVQYKLTGSGSSLRTAFGSSERTQSHGARKRNTVAIAWHKRIALTSTKVCSKTRLSSDGRLAHFYHFTQVADDPSASLPHQQATRAEHAQWRILKATKRLIICKETFTALLIGQYAPLH
jgi:hypothetical protein